MNKSSVDDYDQFFSEEEWESLSDHDKFFADSKPQAVAADNTGEEEPEGDTTPPAPRPNPFRNTRHTEPQTVYTSNKQGDIAIAKSMLMSADIEFFVKGEYVADKFALGGIGNFNNITRGMGIVVRPEDAEDAFDILSPLNQ